MAAVTARAANEVRCVPTFLAAIRPSTSANYTFKDYPTPFRCVDARGRSIEGAFASEDLSRFTALSYTAYDASTVEVAIDFVGQPAFVRFAPGGVRYGAFPNQFDLYNLVPNAMRWGEGLPEADLETHDYTLYAQSELGRYLGEDPFHMDAGNVGAFLSGFELHPAFPKVFTFHWVKPPVGGFVVDGIDRDFSRVYAAHDVFFVATELVGATVVLKDPTRGERAVQVLGDLPRDRWKSLDAKEVTLESRENAPVKTKKLGTFWFPDEAADRPLPREILWVIPGDLPYSGTYLMEKEADYAMGEVSTYWGGPFFLADGMTHQFKLKVKKKAHGTATLEYL